MKRTSGKIKNIFEFLREAMKDKRLKFNDYKVLTALTFLNGFEDIFPSLKAIAQDSGINTDKTGSNISKHLKNLESFGYITKQRRKHKTNIYKLNFIIEMKEEIFTSQTGEEMSLTKLNKLSDEKVNALLQEETEKYLMDVGINKNMLIELMKLNKYISNCKKMFLLMYCIGEVEKRKKNIKAAEGYLRTVFENKSYTQYHKEVFNLKPSNQQNIPDYNIITNPENNY